MKKVLTISGMSCGHCVMRVKKSIEETAGISSVNVDLLEGKAVVVGDNLDSATLQNAVVNAGYTVVSILP